MISGSGDVEPSCIKMFLHFSEHNGWQNQRPPGGAWNEVLTQKPTWGSTRFKLNVFTSFWFWSRSGPSFICVELVRLWPWCSWRWCSAPVQVLLLGSAGSLGSLGLNRKQQTTTRYEIIKINNYFSAEDLLRHLLGRMVLYRSFMVCPGTSSSAASTKFGGIFWRDQRDTPGDETNTPSRIRPSLTNGWLYKVHLHRHDSGTGLVSWSPDFLMCTITFFYNKKRFFFITSFFNNKNSFFL